MYSNTTEVRRKVTGDGMRKCDITGKADAVGATKESFVEEIAFEQSLGSIFVNWEGTVT